MSNPSVAYVPACTTIESLERRVMLAGVTIIAHGASLNGQPQAWTSRMAREVADRIGTPWSDVSWYFMSVGDVASPHVTSFFKLAGPNPNSSSTGEIVVTVDWSEVAGVVPVIPTAEVAAEIVPELLSTTAGLGGPLSELPIHIIGHSRGASLAGALAHELAYRGVWVDQVTYLDSHPTASDYGDADDLRPTNNVVYADSYWRQDGPLVGDLDGESVPGADEHELSDSVFSTAGVNAHSDVRIWYHGTIDTVGEIDSGDGAFNPDDYGWYNVPHPNPRAQTGFYKSRIGGGPRFSGGVAIPFGGSGVRRNVTPSIQPRPNIGYLGKVQSGSSFAVGTRLNITWKYQDVDSTTDIYLYLDRDQNPYNNNFAGGDPALVVSGDASARGHVNRVLTGSSVIGGGTELYTGGAVLTGVNYYVCAKIKDGTSQRFAYLGTPVMFTAVPATLTALSISGPATVNENATGQFTATATFSNGTSATVTPNWSENSSVTTISASGLLAALAVSSNAAVTVSASYTSGGVTKTASANVTVVDGDVPPGDVLERLGNPGFETGTFTPWQSSPAPGAGGPIIANNGFQHGGTRYAVMGEVNSHTDFLWQTFSIPSNATSAELSYWSNIYSEDTKTTAADVLTVVVTDANGNNPQFVESRSNLNRAAAGVYTKTTFNLGSFIGQTRQVWFQASCDASGFTSFKLDDVSVRVTVPPPVTLTGLEISGPNTVNENQTASYSATAIFSDGSVQNVNASWSEDSPVASIASNGTLSAGTVSSDTPLNVSASYTVGGVTRSASKAVTIVDIPVSLVGIAISGPDIVNENSTGQYSCSAIFSDGSQYAVTPAWSLVPATYGSINSSGVLSAFAVPSDQSVQVTATYNGQSDSIGVLINNVDVTPPSVTINQAADQADPATGSPINFTVIFSEPVSGFATGDVGFSGTAPGTLVGTVTGSGTTYNVAVTGMTGAGTVVATIAASLAVDSEGNGNLASTSSDNVVSYDPAAPSFTVTTSASHGVITRSPDQASYAQGSVVTLTAVPDVGYQFAGWGGDATGTTNPLVVTVTANVTITANFSAVSSGNGVMIAGGLVGPSQLHIDGGNIFFADSSSSDGAIKVVSPLGGSVLTLATGLALFDSGAMRPVAPFQVVNDNLYGGYGGYQHTNVFRAPKAGGNAVELVHDLYGGAFIGVIGSNVYYSASFGEVRSVPVGGGSSTPVFNNFWVRSSTVDGDSIYFVDFNNRDVRRFNVVNGGMTTLIPGNGIEGSVFADDANVYLSRGGAILKVAKSGGAVTPLLPEGSDATGYVSDGQWVYFVEGTSIKRVTVNGGTVQTLATVTAGSVNSMAVDGYNLYWTDGSGGTNNGKIWRLRVTDPAGLSSSPGADYVITAAADHKVLTVAGGTVTLGSDLRQMLGVDASVSVSGGGIVFNASQRLRGMNLTGGNIVLAPGGSKVLSLDSFSYLGGTLDLCDNDLVLDAGGGSIVGSANGSVYGGITGLIQSGHHAGAWDGAGIKSSSAASSGGLTALGVAQAADVIDFDGSATRLWNGVTVKPTSVLVKYTYAGDANLDGQITGDDYSGIDFGILVRGASAWQNGDFNYDGVVTGDDYSAIDFAILAQGVQL